MYEADTKWSLAEKEAIGLVAALLLRREEDTASSEMSAYARDADPEPEK